MSTGIILAGGESRRMPGDKAFMEVGGRPVIKVQLETIRPLFDRVLIVANRERLEGISRYSGEGVKVVEEPVRGKGPLGGIMSGLMLSDTERNFILACDMPFVRADAIDFIMESLAGYQVAVPSTPAGLEPLHAAYSRECMERIGPRLETGDLRVTGFFDSVSVNYISWSRMARFDPTGRFLLNVNSPEDIKSTGVTYGHEHNRG